MIRACTTCGKSRTRPPVADNRVVYVNCIRANDCPNKQPLANMFKTNTNNEPVHTPNRLAGAA
jgi:hypothetical protein